MSVAFGAIKHIDNITLEEVLAHPIWISAEADQGLEEHWKAVINREDIHDDLLLIDHPILAFRVAGHTWVGVGFYDHDCSLLYGLYIWLEDHWAPLDLVIDLEMPVILTSIPTIYGQAGVQFILQDISDDRAKRILPPPSAPAISIGTN